MGLMLAASTRSWAVAVFFTTTNLGGGLFQYDLTVDNTGGAEPIQGLSILNGNSVFGLDGTSTIGAPQDIGGNPAADWFFLPPGPPPDSLDYISLDVTADVPVNGSLGGFFFRSMKDPSTLSGNQFAVDLIGSLTGGPIQGGGGIAQPPPTAIPEPSTVVLLTVGVLGLLAVGCRKRKA
jgi:hypothetical protein